MSIVHPEQDTIELHKAGYVQDADPGAIGAGKSWFTETPPIVHSIRNAANSGWDEVTDPNAGSGTVTAVTASGSLSSSGGATPEISHDDTAVTPGTYPKVTVDQEGHVTAGALLAVADMPTRANLSLAKQYSIVTAANTPVTVETDLLTGSIDGLLTTSGGWWTAGRSIEFAGGGYWKISNTAHTFRQRLKMTDTTPTTVIIADTTALPPTSTSATVFLMWEFRYILTCITDGVTGTFRGSGSSVFHDPPQPFDQALPFPNPAGITVALVLDTTLAQTFSMTHEHSNANASNTITLTNFVMRQL